MITILTGTNNYLLRAELRRLVAEFEAEHGDMALERLNGDEASYERMQEAVQSLPFLASRKMVVLLSPSLNKRFAENAQQLLEDLPDTTDLLLVEPKLDKRLAYYKYLKKQGGYTEFSELDDAGLAKWLIGLAREKGAAVSHADARYLVGRVGHNQQALASEIEKLSLHAGRGKLTDAPTTAPGATPKSVDISRTAILEMTVANPQSTIFQLLEAAFAGNDRLALELYREQRAQKVEPQQIIAMLAWQLHIFALVVTAGPGRSAGTIAREAKLSPYVVSKSVSAARDMRPQRIKQLIADLLRIDERLKRESLNADDMLTSYLMNLKY